MTKQFLYALVQNLAKLPVIAAGILVVPCLWPLRHRDIKDMSRWVMPWVNPEDWTGGYRNFPPEFNCVPKNIYDGKQGFWQFYKYHAFRNGGDGLRNYEWHLCRYVEGAMVHTRVKHGDYVQQGKYGSWGLRFGRVHIKYGWRMTPRDIETGYDPKSIRWKYGAGPAWSCRYV